MGPPLAGYGCHPQRPGKPRLTQRLAGRDRQSGRDGSPVPARALYHQKSGAGLRSKTRLAEWFGRGCRAPWRPGDCKAVLPALSGDRAKAGSWLPARGADPHNLGIEALSREDLGEARSLLQRALAIREKLAPGSLVEAMSLNGLGNVVLQQGDLHRRPGLSTAGPGDPGEAGAWFPSCGQGPPPPGACCPWSGRSDRRPGVLPAGPGDPGEAGAWVPALAWTLNDLGLVLAAQGNPAAARSLCQRALAIVEKLGPSSLAFASILDSLRVSLPARRPGDSQACAPTGAHDPGETSPEFPNDSR